MRRLGWLGSLAAVALAPTVARADEPIVQREAWAGHVGFFATGAPMAVDGPDGDTTSVDTLAQPASVQVGPPDVPAGAELTAAYLYWGGSIVNSECGDPLDIDDEVDFTPPGGMAVAVMADACFCSVAGSMAYDVQLCRAEVTDLVPTLAGTYTVDAFEALIGNQTTHNASFSVVVIYRAAGLPPRRVALYDGLLTMSSDTNPEEIITLGGLDIDDPPSGDLTFYVLEGDVGGSSGEGVEVTGMPGGGVLALSDAINPVGNPMNHTINTTVPVQADTLGVDVDRFSIDGALASTDTAVEVRYTAGIDKWWLAYDVVGVNVFEPVLNDSSVKAWTLQDDADGDGGPSVGDTVRYSLQLHNSGNVEGVVQLSDPIPAEAASWSLVDAAGGVDTSTADTLVVGGLVVAPGATVEVLFDMVIDAAPEGTEIVNVAQYTVEPGGSMGQLWALPVVVGEAAGGSTGGGSTGGGESTSAGGTDTGTSEATSDEGGSGSVPPVDGTAGDATQGATSSEGATSVALTGGGAEASGCGCGNRAPPGAWAWWWVLLLARRRSAAAR